MITEIELRQDNETLALPSRIGREVTGDLRYRKFNLRALLRRAADEQYLPVLRRGDRARNRTVTGCFDAERFRERGPDLRRRHHGREIDEVHSVRMARIKSLGGRDRDPRLSNPAGTDDRDEPPARQLRQQRANEIVPAERGRDRRREPPSRDAPNPTPPSRSF